MVPNVQAVEAPSFILPRDTGESQRGLNVLNGWNDLNNLPVVRPLDVNI
jgi:hypothetical protein